jgi:hypothetical protein
MVSRFAACVSIPKQADMEEAETEGAENGWLQHTHREQRIPSRARSTHSAANGLQTPVSPAARRCGFNPVTPER